jgi:hypothetical protein
MTGRMMQGSSNLELRLRFGGNDSEVAPHYRFKGLYCLAPRLLDPPLRFPYALYRIDFL